MIELNRYIRTNVLGALQDELPGEDEGELRERAAGLIAIAEAAGVPIEMLLAWIHASAPEKEWSLAEFRAWCARWAAEKQREGCV